jgi:hypothetical protein
MTLKKQATMVKGQWSIHSLNEGGEGLAKLIKIERENIAGRRKSQGKDPEVRTSVLVQETGKKPV